MKPTGEATSERSADDPARDGAPVTHQGRKREASTVESAPTLRSETPVDRVSGPHALPVRIGETVAGKYRIECVIGQGGAGIVYAATNVDLDERVALKFLRPDVGVLP